MHKYFLTAAVAATLVAPAQAADIPVKAPRVAEVVYSWTGVYFGLNAGGVRTEFDWTFLSPAGGSTAAASQRFNDFIGGGQLGVQWQFGSIVLGAEAAFSTTFRKGFKERASSNCAFPPPFDDRCDATKFSGLFTIGPRVGWAPTNQLLFFGTGGYAQANLATAIRFGGVGVPPAPGALPVTASERTHHGWYAGGGAEFAITRNWSVGVEYQHVELDNKGHCVGNNNCGVTSILNRNVKADADIVRVRVNLRPDWPQALSAPWGRI